MSDDSKGNAKDKQTPKNEPKKTYLVSTKDGGLKVVKK